MGKSEIPECGCRVHRVTLSVREMYAICAIAGRRQIEVLGRELREPGNRTDLERQLSDLFGVMGEAAVAKAFNVFYLGDTGLGEIDVPGIGRGLEVRTSRHHGPHYRLLIYDRDPPATPFVYATVEPGRGFPIEVWLHGVILAETARRPEWFDAARLERPGYRVPHTALDPLVVAW